MSAPTFEVPMIRLDIPDAELEMVEVYADGTFVHDPWPDRVLTDTEETVMVTRTELADMITNAVIASQSAQADARTVRSAALGAIEPLNKAR